MFKPMTILAMLSLIVALTACGRIGAIVSPTPPPTPDPIIVGAEEYAVYSVLVRAYSVYSETCGNYCCVEEQCVPGLTSEMISDLQAKSQYPSPLDSARFKNSGTRGTVSFSRVGFNATRDRAVVYAAYVEGWQSGTGYCIVLAKQDGLWSVENRITMVLW